MGQELWQKEEELEQCQEYDEVFFRLDHFAERYLGKLDDVQCHRKDRKVYSDRKVLLRLKNCVSTIFAKLLYISKISERDFIGKIQL